MKALFLAILLLAGTAYAQTSENTASEITKPRLVKQTPLPLLKGQAARFEMPIEARLLVDTDGSVVKAIITGGSGDKEWDTKAMETLTDWKYSPAMEEGQPVKIWVTQSIKLRHEENVYEKLAQQ